MDISSIMNNNTNWVVDQIGVDQTASNWQMVG